MTEPEARVVGNPPEVVVMSDQPDGSRLLLVLAGALGVIALMVGVLAWSYFRVATQLDRTRERTASQSEVIEELSGRIADDSIVLAQVRDLAVLFTGVLNPDAAQQAEARRRLAELSEEIRRDQARRDADETPNERERATTTTTTAPSTTSTTPATTTTTRPLACVTGICIGGTP